jgi:glycosyltransferase involved in cell wall biosynthesis
LLHNVVEAPSADEPALLRSAADRAGRRGSHIARQRLLFVVNSLAGGGAERVFSTLLAGLEQTLAPYEVHVALLDQEPAAYSLPDWVRLHQLDCRRSLVRSVRQLAALAGQVRPQLVFSFLTRANVAAVAAARRARCPVIISERNDTTAQLSHGRFPAVARAVVRLAYHRADRVIAVSSGLQESLASHYRVEPRRITVINNPVDVVAIRSAAHASPAIDIQRRDVVMLARLEPQKNLHVAIRAFAASGVDGRLVILGEGSLRAELRALGDSCGLGDRLVMPGHVSNPFAVLSRASAFMLTSRHEGFCNSLVEAMALGIPVLASDCRFSPAEILGIERTPGRGEVIEGQGGLLVAIDDTEAFASALRMLADAGLRQRLGQLGAKRVLAFAAPAQIARYGEVIAQALSPDVASKGAAA